MAVKVSSKKIKEAIELLDCYGTVRMEWDAALSRDTRRPVDRVLWSARLQARKAIRYGSLSFLAWCSIATGDSGIDALEAACKLREGWLPEGFEKA